MILGKLDYKDRDFFYDKEYTAILKKYPVFEKAIVHKKVVGMKYSTLFLFSLLLAGAIFLNAYSPDFLKADSFSLT
jgi:hypothetical protein